MGKQNKNKSELKLTINLSDEGNLKYITNAYGLFCRYRTLNQQPIISIENWLAANIIEASKHLYTYHAEQIRALKELEEKAKVLDENTDKLNNALTNEVSDKIKEAVNALNEVK